MKKSIPIELDKMRNLRLGVNAICDIESITGKSISNLTDGAGLADIRTILYCGLRWEDDEIEMETVGDLIENADLKMVANKIGEAIELALPSGKKKVNPVHPAMKK
jgi:hypothetical protein